MLRRKFITLFGGAAAIWPLAASAQQPTVPVIGFLSGATFETMREYVVAFHRGLVDAGFVEGRNLAVEYDGRKVTTIGCLHWLRIWFVMGWPL
jgi:putative ABC transport system substrate-binding protein